MGLQPAAAPTNTRTSNGGLIAAHRLVTRSAAVGYTVLRGVLVVPAAILDPWKAPTANDKTLRVCVRCSEQCVLTMSPEVYTKAVPSCRPTKTGPPPYGALVQERYLWVHRMSGTSRTRPAVSKQKSNNGWGCDRCLDAFSGQNARRGELEGGRCWYGRSLSAFEPPQSSENVGVNHRTLHYGCCLINFLGSLEYNG